MDPVLRRRLQSGGRLGGGRLPPPNFSYSLDTLPGSCPDIPALLRLERTVTVDDGCGNAASQSYLIEIVDTVAPVMTDLPLRTIELNCGEALPGTAGQRRRRLLQLVESGIHSLRKVAQGGKATAEGANTTRNSVRWLLFDAHTDIVIESVKVFASGAGERTMAVIDESGNVLNQLTVEVPDGEGIVHLDFAVPQEQTTVCTLDNDPQLWRDGPESTMDYPYAIGDLYNHRVDSRRGQCVQLLLLLL